MSNILNRFAVNPVNLDIPRSKFDLDHTVTFSFNCGDLIPFTFFDVLPGSTFSVDTSKVIRVQPLVAPIFGNLYCDFYWFFVPYRLIWSHFPEFMGENTSTAWTPVVTYTVPQTQIPGSGYNIGTIADYLGVPPKVPGYGGDTISSLPFRAYATICNEWFRSESIQNPVHVSTGDATTYGSNGADQVSDIEKGGQPFVVNKFFDLFTAALPAPQRGPAASFSLAGLAPVYAHNTTPQPFPSTADTLKYAYKNSGGNWTTATMANARPLGMDTDTDAVNSNGAFSGTLTEITPYNLVADLSSISQFNVNELRMAFAVQRYYEALARGGARYISQVKEFFGVTSSDYRFMRPEYLGGSRVPVQISQTVQTSETTATSPLGEVAGLSVTGDIHSDFSKSFSEHGIILGLVCCRYDHIYQQSLEKFWTKKDLFDFYNPKFANIGEQPVYKEEICMDGSPLKQQVFGYNEAWYEYRFKSSRVAGQLRTVSNSGLDSWHLGDYYSQAPTLSAGWLREDKSNLDRCLAVTSSQAHQLIADIFIKCSTAQPMPMYSIPGLLDHH